MRKLAGITVLVLLISFSINAQQKQQKQRKGSDFTTEQMATLKMKQMTLDLDLNASQQKEVFELMKKSTEERKNAMTERKENKQSGVELTSDQKFAIQNNRLDKMIAHKTAMKNILSKDQYEKWEKKMKHQKRSGKKNMAKNNQKGMKGGQQKKRPDNNRI
ncbi:hypothetical protein SAMN06265371_103371 [Lutibacter agarilyticus]|uniref:LTXXQ motif family protein n=1 Tax=Lutibacter agarilyticus TaxID=1109740 RepID=A0A238WPM0_9FLAO|nr:hypothetical protein [Lutibacter agarilyticus]SNR47629.1 hypothetical protein SAMN06265371_103371 [Lutibacter agarilyticus]